VKGEREGGWIPLDPLAGSTTVCIGHPWTTSLIDSFTAPVLKQGNLVYYL